MKNQSKLKIFGLLTFLLIGFISLNSCSTEDIEVFEEEISIEDNIKSNVNAQAKCQNPYAWLQSKYGNSNVNWKLQYPSGSSAKTAYRYKSTYLKDVSSSRFSMVGSSCNRLRFRVDGNDPTSGNSPNPRCELRERTKKKFGSNSDKDAGWKTSRSDFKELIFKAKVTAAPSSSGSSLVIAQLHSGGNGGSDTAVIKVKKSSGKFKLLLTGGGISGDVTLDSDYKVNNEIFTITLRVWNNKVRVKYNGNWKNNGKSIASSYRTSTSYFKAGAYILSANSNEEGKVEFYDVKLNKYENY